MYACSQARAHMHRWQVRAYVQVADTHVYRWQIRALDWAHVHSYFSFLYVHIRTVVVVINSYIKYSFAYVRAVSYTHLTLPTILRV